MDTLKQKYLALMKEKGAKRKSASLVMELHEERDKAIIEEYLREHFTQVAATDTLGIEQFLEIQKTAEGLEGNVLIRGNDDRGTALYFEIADIDPKTVQKTLRRLDEFYIHVTGKDRAEIIKKLRSFFPTEETEFNPQKDEYGVAYAEKDYYCIKARVNNKLGIHTRPASLLIKESIKYTSEISLIKSDGQEANAKSILNIMMLGAECGSDIIIRAKGSDAENAVKGLYKIIRCLKDYD